MLFLLNLVSDRFFELHIWTFQNYKFSLLLLHHSAFLIISSQLPTSRSGEPAPCHVRTEEHKFRFIRNDRSYLQQYTASHPTISGDSILLIPGCSVVRFLPRTLLHACSYLQIVVFFYPIKHFPIYKVFPKLMLICLHFYYLFLYFFTLSFISMLCHSCISGWALSLFHQ